MGSYIDDHVLLFLAGDVLTVSGEGTPDVTVELNNANVLRHSMRKYGPYAGNLRRNSISSDSLHAPALASLPFRPSAVERRPFTHRYSCIGMTYNIPQVQNFYRFFRSEITDCFAVIVTACRRRKRQSL